MHHKRRSTSSGRSTRVNYRKKYKVKGYAVRTYGDRYATCFGNISNNVRQTMQRVDQELIEEAFNVEDDEFIKETYFLFMNDIEAYAFYDNKATIEGWYDAYWQ